VLHLSQLVGLITSLVRAIRQVAAETWVCWAACFALSVPSGQAVVILSATAKEKKYKYQTLRLYNKQFPAGPFFFALWVISGTAVCGDDSSIDNSCHRTRNYVPALACC
jgi:hypothetical protein